MVTVLNICLPQLLVVKRLLAMPFLLNEWLILSSLAVFYDVFRY